MTAAFSLPEILQAIESYCNTNKLNHRFVGSVSFGGLLRKETTHRIDIKKKTVRLLHHAPLSVLRDDGTVRDIDIILFCKEKEKIIALKRFLSSLKSPLISIEAALYPSFGKRNIFFQFVTALEVDKENRLFLAFDAITQHISWKSVEPWTVILENDQKYTVRNPVADYYAYQFRSPSGIRPKDMEKVLLLKKLADEVIKKGNSHHINYISDDYYRPWQTYTQQLQQTNRLSVLLKRKLSYYYWKTVGTYFAHGKGTGKLFLFLSNQFTGIKQ